MYIHVLLHLHSVQSPISTAKVVVISSLCIHVCTLCRALGLLAAKLSISSDSTSQSDHPPSSPPHQSSSTLPHCTQALSTLCEGLRQMLVRCSSTHRTVASLVVGYWGQCPSDLLSLLTTVLTEQASYEEIMPFLVAMQRDCHVRYRYSRDEQ